MSPKTPTSEDAGDAPEVTEETAPDQTLPPPQEGPFEGEVGPLILAGYWVRLSADGTVPDEFVGHLATITDSPWKPAPIGIADQPITGYTFDEDGTYTVRTRDEHNAYITELTLDAFQEVNQNRVGVHT